MTNWPKDWKGKLSKRDGDKHGFPVFPMEWKTEEGVAKGYKDEGYFPEAVLNMLALLGWSAGTDQEIFTMDELIAQFSLEKVSKSGARFSPDKAVWFNNQYLQQKSAEGTKYPSRLSPTKHINAPKIATKYNFFSVIFLCSSSDMKIGIRLFH